MDWSEKHKSESVEWTPDVVFNVYRNDDLNTLPIGILEDMKIYIDSIIKNKKRS